MTKSENGTNCENYNKNQVNEKLVLKHNILGRLGRVSQTYARKEKNSSGMVKEKGEEKEEVKGEENIICARMFGKSVPSVPAVPNSFNIEQISYADFVNAEISVKMYSFFVGDFFVVSNSRIKKQIERENQGAVVYLPDEILHLRGMTPEDAQKAHMVKKSFGGLFIDNRPASEAFGSLFAEEVEALDIEYSKHGITGHAMDQTSPAYLKAQEGQDRLDAAWAAEPPSYKQFVDALRAWKEAEFELCRSLRAE